MNLIEELKRRNVFRIGLAYLAGAWLVIQIAETLFEVFGLGDDAVRLVVILLAIGFVPALIVAWVFELTPEGLMRESKVDRSDSTARGTGKNLDRAIIVVLAMALVYFAVDKFVVSPQRQADLIRTANESRGDDEKTLAQSAKSIAVLPFSNLSDDRANEYFSDGLTETLMHMLGQMAELRVSARTSSFAFKDRNADVREIALVLGVANVLDGSVQKSGNRIRITAQLVRAEDGFNLWSSSYDRTLDDIFAIQDEIATHILSNLKVTFAGDDSPQFEARGRLNSAAYELYLKGRYYWNQRTNEGYRNAIELFQQAIEIDPDYALAYVGLADAQAFAEVEGSSSLEQYEIAFGIIRKALEIDGSLGEAHASMGLLLQNKDWDLAGAERQYRRAIELSPNYASAFHWYGELLVQLQRFDEAIDVYGKASALDPLSSAISSDIGITSYFARDYERAVEVLQTSIQADPAFSRSYHYLARVLAHIGQYRDAIQARRRAWLLAGIDPDDVERRVAGLLSATEREGASGFWRQQLELAGSYRGADWPVDVAELHARLGETDRAFDLLEEGLAARKFAMLFLDVDPAWDVLRDDERFHDLSRRIRAPVAVAETASGPPSVPHAGAATLAAGEIHADPAYVTVPIVR